MMKKIVPVLMILLLALAACGGDSSEPAAAPAEPETAVETAAETTTETEPEPAADVAADTAETTDAEPAAEEEMPAEEAAAEDPTAEPVEEPPAAEEAAAGPIVEGTDAETGLIINPDNPSPGDTFIVRGQITSMNLTPQTSPEFLLQAPSGTRYRMSTQPVDETFVEDGSQLQAYEYKIGMWAEATVSLAADAGPSDIYSSDDLTILLYEE